MGVKKTGDEEFDEQVGKLIENLQDLAMTSLATITGTQMVREVIANMEKAALENPMLMDARVQIYKTMIAGFKSEIRRIENGELAVSDG